MTPTWETELNNSQAHPLAHHTLSTQFVRPHADQHLP